MEPNLKNTSKIKRKLVIEILGIWDKHKKDGDKSRFAIEAKDLGWNDLGHTNGSFKVCFSKNSMIAKYSRTEDPNFLAEIEREAEQYTTIPRDVRKYFPRIYAFKNGLIVQDKVLVTCGDNKGLCNLNNVASEIGNMADYTHNHGHSLAGTVKFFDWVYKRKLPWLGSYTKSLSEGIKND